MLNAKQYSAMESSLEKSLTAFNEACDDMCTSRYIIAGAKISTVLRTIAGSRPLYEFFAHAVNGFDFIEYFTSIKFRDLSGNLYLEIPSNPQLKVAFTFCLLYALDTGRVELKDLLHNFYTDVDTNAEYSRFCYDIIAPFRSAVNDFMDEKITLVDIEDIINGKDANDQPKSPDTKPDVDTLSEPDPITTDDAPVDKGIKDAIELINEIKQIVTDDKVITETERKEIITVLSTLHDAFEYKERDGINIMFIAAKNTLKVSTIYSKIQPQYNALKIIVDTI